MDLHVYNTLILSDLHLGAETSHAREATRVLKENRFQRLILLGDIFADLNFARLTKDHWKFLGYIRKLSNPKRNIEVVWVEGNHDHGLTNIMSHLVGVRVYQHYAWQYGGLRHIAIHGHQFDGFQVNNVRLSTAGHFALSATAEARFQEQADRAAHRPAEHALAPHVVEGFRGSSAIRAPARRRSHFLRPHSPGRPRRTGRNSLLQLRRLGRFPPDVSHG